MSDWSSGQQLGPYTLISRIGAGGMGEVWKARDTRLDRFVAVKRLKADEAGRFQKEARAIASLNHPHICQIYDVGPDHLVMEYIDGKPLQGALPEEETVRLAIQIAGALQEAHKRGIIHRDLKPGNIMVTLEGSAKLLDFGLAKSTKDADPDLTGTIAGTIMGTTAYMSPEQASGKPLDERSDIFSLGAVVYEMVSGKCAFEGESVTEILTRVIRDEPHPLQASAGLARVVAKCLAKQPSQRFQTVRELKADLEKIRPQGATSEPSIAVLPFTNMSGDKDNEYFSDGLTEELINALAHIHGLKVTARTSAFAFRGMEQDIRKIAFTLGVKTILEGSVRRSGNRIRVTAQLISAEDGYHLWSERYDREVADIFAMQDEIAQAIAGALKIRLSAAAPVPRRYVPKLPAYEALLKGRHAFAKFTNESLRRSREYCEQAISLDPQYALPYGDLSHSMLVQTITGVLPAHEGMPKAREGALRAIAIDRGLPEAHAILGAVAALYDYDWTQAEREFHQAMSSEPISSFVRQGYAMYFLIPRGRLDDALQELDLSLREDPLFIPARYAKGTCQMVAGNFADAEATFKSCLELDETFFPAWGGLAAIATFSGAFDKALELSKRAIAIAPVPSYIGAHAGVLARLGNTTESAEWLARLSDPKTYPVPMALALYHLQLGELDQVAEWMVKAIEQRYPLIPNLLRGPVGKALRQTSRWDELVSLVRLPAS